MTEYVDIVDDNITVIGTSTRTNAHIKGLLHPTVNVLVINSKGQIFLQQRSSKKTILPLHWDISMAEHVQAGETYYQAALRGLKEELSLIIPVKLLRNYHIKISHHKVENKIFREYELTKLYLAVYNGEIKIDNGEVGKGIFMGVNELKKSIYQSKTPFTPWGLDELLYVIRNYKKIKQDYL